MSMDDNAKIIVRGVLDKIEADNITENAAYLIRNALKNICGGNWNVITYPTFESEKGNSSSCLHWRDKQWVYAEQTKSTDVNWNATKTFMDTEFGWATIRNTNTVHQSAYTKIDNEFCGTWKVHVARINDEFSACLDGTTWKSGIVVKTLKKEISKEQNLEKQNPEKNIENECLEL